MQRDDSFDERDDGPSAEDIARFSRPVDTRCQECGHRIYEDVDICPHCRAFVFSDESAGRAKAVRPVRMLFLLALALIALVLSGVLALLVR